MNALGTINCERSQNCVEYLTLKNTHVFEENGITCTHPLHVFEENGITCTPYKPRIVCVLYITALLVPTPYKPRIVCGLYICNLNYTNTTGVL